MKASVVLKKWGSSLGLVVPSEVVKQEHLEEGEEVVIEIEPKKRMLEAFGFLRRYTPKEKITALNFKKEIRKEEEEAEGRHYD